MGNPFAGEAGHSAEYFGDTRDFWYARDFVALLAARWRLGDVHDALDVGCGVGHWGRLLVGAFAAGARMVGIDREPSWLEVARERAAALGMDDRVDYRPGSAEALPFADDSFDLVTCQTLLIHVRDPRAVLAEMTRVTRPGGLVAVAEPNNLARALLSPDVLAEPVEDLVALVRFQLVCERGKQALGEGNNSVGEAIPSLFHAVGLQDIQICLNDKAAPLIPPYASPEERAGVEELRAFGARDFWIWSRDDTRRYFLAGGGEGAAFEAMWSLALEQQRRTAKAVDRDTFAAAGGSVLYLAAGRKPNGTTL
jgi:SAM-dependent methyltransferase